MIEILTVCTGNICRSPLAELMLRARLADFAPTVASAGTHGLPSAPMTSKALALAVAAGVRHEDAASHRSRYLTEALLSAPDLVLAMTRDHRRAVVELAPARVRSTFTIREFARLAASLSDDELRTAADEGGTDAESRVGAVVAAVSGQRGTVEPPTNLADDDVVDPYGRSWETYQRSAAQLAPAVDEVVRALVIALEGASAADETEVAVTAAPDSLPLRRDRRRA
ncbi:low molecular weight phosphatase family protein [Microbacterium sp. NPDC019599]|uniref:arsenate reductase/protein-tyrosine-phosphatase family protein n=1 Tax=Microbacterium sp. NPDC019599 TaxID=3154690 RepID=UPI0033EC4884